MTNYLGLRPLVLIGTAAALLVCGSYAQAQTIRPGGSARGVNRTTGGLGTTGAGRGGTGVGSSATSGPRQYRSNTLLGDALIQIDPETRSLVIVTDEETHEEMQKVIRDLDRPKPQVLIKVVFLEVTYDKGMDLGVEGTYTFNLKNSLVRTVATVGGLYPRPTWSPDVRCIGNLVAPPLRRRTRRGSSGS